MGQQRVSLDVAARGGARGACREWRIAIAPTLGGQGGWRSFGLLLERGGRGVGAHSFASIHGENREYPRSIGIAPAVSGRGGWRSFGLLLERGGRSFGAHSSTSTNEVFCFGMVLSAGIHTPASAPRKQNASSAACGPRQSGILGVNFFGGGVYSTWGGMMGNGSHGKWAFLFGGARKQPTKRKMFVVLTIFLCRKLRISLGLVDLNRTSSGTYFLEGPSWLGNG